jgi:hypothetical protein
MLTRKQRVFVDEYLTCWNATEAARRAGFKHPHVQGPRLLANVRVKPFIEQRMQEKAMAADEVLFRLAQQARVSMADFMNERGGLDIEKVRVHGHLVHKLTPTKYGDTIELVDNQAALVQIGRALGIFTDKSEIRLPDGPIVEQVVFYIPDNGRDKKDASD